MDEKDKKILKILENNARLSIQSIAKKTFIPITTVYNRLKKLESNIIQKYTVVYDNRKLGRTTCAFVMIQVNNKAMKEAGLREHDIAKKIKAFPLVEEANLVTGNYDILIKIRASSTEEMNKFILTQLRDIDYVEKTYTLVVIGEAK